MKVVLICPAERSALAPLTEQRPAVTCPFFGKSLIEHWLAHVAAAGVKEVLILASDRPADVAAVVGDGTRWGLRVSVRSEMRQRTLAEVRAKHQPENKTPPPYGDIIVVDHFPGLPRHSLFGSGAEWFAGLQHLLRKGLVPPLLGVREVQPGIWAGRHTHIAADARLTAPCWIGDNVWIGSRAIIGPGCVIEHRVFLASGAEISHSFVAPDTYVGESTLVRDSIACGRWLLNWRNNSCLRVPDPFLLCSLRELQVLGAVTWPAQIASLIMLGLTLPLGLLGLLKSKLQEAPALRRLVIREEGQS